MNKHEIKITADNSPTLYNREIGEHYRSVNGAVQESMHVFIKNGLNTVKKENIKILETGFGTGLNAVLTLIEAEKNKQKIYYETIEKYPLSENIIDKLFCFIDSGSNRILKQIHLTDWNKEVKITDFFTIKKIQADLLDFIPDKIFDIIYFDAFSPNKQPELWTTEIFRKIFNATSPQGILLTYSAKGTVKQALGNAGYTIKRLPGPPGKHHIIRAIKK